jgi:hypothetical protein
MLRRSGLYRVLLPLAVASFVLPRFAEAAEKATQPTITAPAFSKERLRLKDAPDLPEPEPTLGDKKPELKPPPNTKECPLELSESPIGEQRPLTSEERFLKNLPPPEPEDNDDEYFRKNLPPPLPGGRGRLKLPEPEPEETLREVPWYKRLFDFGSNTRPLNKAEPKKPETNDPLKLPPSGRIQDDPYRPDPGPRGLKQNDNSLMNIPHRPPPEPRSKDTPDAPAQPKQPDCSPKIS